MSGRYDVASKSLDLKGLHGDSGLNKECIHLALSRPNVMSHALRIIGDYIPEVRRRGPHSTATRVVVHTPQPHAAWCTLHAHTRHGPHSTATCSIIHTPQPHAAWSTATRGMVHGHTWHGLQPHAVWSTSTRGMVNSHTRRVPQPHAAWSTNSTSIHMLHTPHPHAA